MGLKMIHTVWVALSVLHFNVLGIVFPGPCPVIEQPNTVLQNNNETYVVLSVVPLTKQFTSYLFSETGRWCEARFINATVFQMHRQLECSVATINLTALDDDLIVAVTAMEYPESCLAVEENVRVFIYDYFGFIWTCKELPYRRSHDEGLVLLEGKYIYFDYEFGTGERIKFIFNALEDYISAELFKEVKSREQLGGVPCRTQNPNGPCPILDACKPKFKFLQYVFPTILMMVLIIFIGYTFWKNFKGSNRIRPAP